MNHYPIPRDYPEYQSPPEKVSDGRRFSIYAALDAVFIVVALGLALWLAYILLVGSFVWSVKLVIPLTFGWATLAYLALPRLHQLFTLLYVPNYFIGRTKTVDGILGDPVNLAFDGTETDVHAAMRNAGWVPADPITLRSSWNIIISSVFGTSYPQAPVSNLYLFDTKQDFAYQQEVSGNASQRHHVRFWRVPEGWVLPGGYRADWLAAGTYDRSVGFSSFTFQFTHKVDADTDLERDYIVKTLRFSDHDIGVQVIRDFSTAYHQRNGGGQNQHRRKPADHRRARCRPSHPYPGTQETTQEAARPGRPWGAARVAPCCRRVACPQHCGGNPARHSRLDRPGLGLAAYRRWRRRTLVDPAAHAIHVPHRDFPAGRHPSAAQMGPYRAHDVVRDLCGTNTRSINGGNHIVPSRAVRIPIGVCGVGGKWG